MKYLLILVAGIMIIGCSDSQNDIQKNVDVSDVSDVAKIHNVSLPDLPETISYREAIDACNLTNISGITLKNYGGRFIWSVSLDSKSSILFCRVDAENGKIIKIEQVPIPDYIDSSPLTRVPLEKIKVDEHSAVEISLKTKEIVEWLNKHDNAIIDRISLESSSKITLWRITWTDEGNFAILMSSVNATTGKQISVRGTSFGDMMK